MFRFFHFLICLVLFNTNILGQEKQFHILINKELLQQKSIVINMLPKIYDLEEVTVKAKKAVPIFRKVLKKFQFIPFNREPKSLKFTYKRNNQLLLKGETQYTSGLFKGFQIIDTSVFAFQPKFKKSTKVMMQIIWSVTRMTLFKRSINQAYYQGKKDSITYWKLKVKDKKKKVVKMTLTDDFTGLVGLNSMGIIKSFDMQMVTNNETSSSYMLKTKYRAKENNIFPFVTEGEFIVKNKSNSKFEKIEFKFEYID